MRRGYLGWCLLLVGMLWLPARFANSDFPEIENHWDYAFGSQVTISAKIPPEYAGWLVFVSLQSQGDAQATLGEAQVNGEQAIYVQDLASKPLRAFSQVSYWFTLQSPDGKQQLTSKKYVFSYEDNRYQWKELQDAPFSVHWYDGDLAYGQMLLDTARNGAEKGLGLLPFASFDPVNIYVYASGAEMQATQRLVNLNLIAGHASPDLHLVVVSIPPGVDQRLEMERQIPHELMHILLYQMYGSGYAHLPVWLNEGLASINEIFRNPDYPVLLDNANQKGALIPLNALCGGFPLDASNFYLSYAQSESFVRFLYDRLGSSGMKSLLDAYADGLGCEQGMQRATGQTLSEAEKDWKALTFGAQSILPESIQSVLPWVGVFLLGLGMPLLLMFGSLIKSARKSPQKAVAQSPQATRVE
jgi:hypothetical protein